MKDEDIDFSDEDMQPDPEDDDDDEFGSDDDAIAGATEADVPPDVSNRLRASRGALCAPSHWLPRSPMMMMTTRRRRWTRLVWAETVASASVTSLCRAAR
jgi:hypothetical protein